MKNVKQIIDQNEIPNNLFAVTAIDSSESKPRVLIVPVKNQRNGEIVRDTIKANFPHYKMVGVRLMAEVKGTLNFRHKNYFVSKEL